MVDVVGAPGAVLVVVADGTDEDASALSDADGGDAAAAVAAAADAADVPRVEWV